MSSIGRFARLLPLLFALALLGCGESSLGTPGSATPDEAAQGADGDDGPSLHEQMGWAEMDPLAWLAMLEKEGKGGIHTILVPAPGGWLTEEHVAGLMAKIDDETPAASVVSVLSSYIPFDRTSTVGNEAMFLVHAFREGGRYPVGLCSVYYFRPDPEEFKTWWEARE